MLSELFINGTWQKPSTPGTIDVFNPCTEEVLHRVAAGGPADVNKAVAAAKAALPSWKKAGGAARGRFLKAIAAKLRERAEELATLSSRNNGKPLAEARVDMADAAASFDYYAGKAVELEARQNSDVAVPDANYRSQLRLEPAGVAALIVPWNFPLVTTSWKVAPALAAGCTVVLKPSEITPIVELELGRIVADIGLPPGVINIVTGLGTVGAAMTMHPDVAKISFTGSNGVGARVMQAASAGPKSVGLELGGKSPIVVFADADEQMAAELIVGGIFYNAGQMCSATSRLVVEKSVALRILERVVAMAKILKHGDSLDPATTMGPLTTKVQYDKVLEYIAKGKALGHRLITGGGKPGGINRGWFLEPTIFTDVPLTSPLWREEIFGPVLCVQTFEREEEAIALANDCDFGLVATLVSSDPKRAERVADTVEAGHVWINSPQTIFVETSWGGFKASGIGRELGPWGLSAYLEVKHKTTRLQA
ncbi:MAG TPA: aldehyde dehydrogenase family protein [Aestuariivirga sp.]|jgi:betaine-aldehyde dehydrogenase|nr:aldehyde dehydrogenase family protein [Aestuariivirga sp.]